MQASQTVATDTERTDATSGTSPADDPNREQNTLGTARRAAPLFDGHLRQALRSQTTMTAADLLNDRVTPFSEEQELRIDAC